ncbi:MAG TPA: SAM-dependent methyltransferase [Gammaproteobacteria bacterium]|nr:SAM-dependent methyltransferase [Gammaproteobacteria bacterium]
MSYDQSISEHYLHGSLLSAIEAALPALGKSIENVTIDDLAPVDEFHIGGRLATDHLMGELQFPEGYHVLDVGCGLGGPARYVATHHKNAVTGIDLTTEYIETGNALCGWVGLGERVTLQQGNALRMPFESQAFEGAYMLHVGMNIEDKSALFSEIYRVLKPGSTFGVYDVMRQTEGDLSYPVPWASESSMSQLSTPIQYKQALTAAGFEVFYENNRRDFALTFFNNLRAKTEAEGGPAPLGLHTLMQQSSGPKIKNMVTGIAEGVIAPVEIIAKKHP